jgi:hypothetical protein
MDARISVFPLLKGDNTIEALNAIQARYPGMGGVLAEAQSVVNGLAEKLGPHMVRAEILSPTTYRVFVFLPQLPHNPGFVTQDAQE